MRWPMLGRAAELAHATSCVAERRGALVLTGPAGVGKTRLAGEAAHALARRGHTVERATATTSSQRIPFGSISHLLPRPDRGFADSFELLQHARDALLRRAEGSRLLLAIDDAHLLDDGSATLVHQLVSAGELRVLATVRTGEPAPEPVVALWKDDLAERRELGPLDRDAVAQLVATAVDGEVAATVVERLWALSEGNPLYLRELVDGALATGVLRPDEHGTWQLVGELEPSRWLTEIIETRLRWLSTAERDAAEALAVGQPLELELLRELAEPDAIERLEDGEVVRISRDRGRVEAELVHPVYAEVLRAELPHLRWRRLAGRLADALDARGSEGPTDLLRRATWRLEAGGPLDPAVMTDAAAEALAVFDDDLAERLARAALDAGEPSFETLLVHGKALAWQPGRSEQADQSFLRAEELATDDDQRARAALARARSLFFQGGQPDHATEVAKYVSERLTDDGWRDEVDAMLALFASIRGDLPRAAAAGRRMKRRTAAPERPLRATLAVATFSEVLLGRFEDAEQSIRLGLSVAERPDGVAHRTADLLACYQAMLDAYAGRCLVAERTARDGFAAARARRVDVAGPWGDVLCHVLILRGLVAEAAEVGRTTDALLRERDPFGVLGMTLGGWALAAALRRDEDTASHLLARLDATESLDPRPGIFSDLARARLLAVRGEVSDAARLAAASGRRAVDGNHLVWGSFLLHEAVRLGRPREVLADLRDVAGRVEGELIPLLAEHAEVLDARDAAGLAAVADRFAEAGAMLHAAEAAAQAAAGHHSAGRPRLARQWAVRASGWHRRCEGAWAPDLAAPTEELTPREREIALLAARGLTSPQVAERLVVSPRTVDNHLRSVYTKLGVAGRGELAEILDVG